MTGLEGIANAVMAASILLAARNSVHTWWIGIVGCALFALLFAQARLYADVTLQAFFIATSAFGWWQWLRGRAGRPLPVTHLHPKWIPLLAALAILATAGYGFLLHRHTDAYMPFADSGVLFFSVVAQLLLMQRRVEAWPFWLLVNSIAVPLFFSRGLYLTSALYTAYWVNAAVAWPRWRRLADEARATRAGRR